MMTSKNGVGTRLLAIFIAVVTSKCAADNILVLHPFYAGSHVLTLHSVSEQLIKRGHSVTTVRFADQHNIILRPLGPQHRELILHVNNSLGHIPMMTKEEKSKFTVPMELLWHDGLAINSILKIPGNPWTLVRGYCHRLLGDHDLFDMLKEEKFDVALVDLLYNECGLALAHRLDIPVVGYWAFSFSSGEPEFSPVATPPSHIPAFMTGLTHNMTFWERVYNFANKVFARLFMHYHVSVCDEAIREHYPTAPSSAELIAEVGGVLINSDSILDYPRLLPETFVNVGGLQIASKRRPLPQDIASWIDGAEHGVILLTMGFIFDPSVVPGSRVDAILGALSRLPQRVIIKFEGETLRKLPSNVLALSFLPQQDILAHNKTLLFFTHCGMHGVMEAIYYGVPVIGMPVFIDQMDVRARVEEKGIGLGVSKMASEEEIYRTIVRVRDDEKIRSNVASLSRLMRLRRHPAMEDALWLLDYVTKTNGAKHLLPSSRHMSLVEYFCLDVIALLVAFTYFTLKAPSLLLRLCQRRREDQSNSKNKAD